MVTWKMINLGQVSRNQFWGEPDDVVRRPGICNGVVLFDTEQVVLVDPPYSNEEMLRCLDAHAGLKPKDIDVVYTCSFRPLRWDSLFPCRTLVYRDGGTRHSGENAGCKEVRRQQVGRLERKVDAQYSSRSLARSYNGFYRAAF